MSIPAGRSLEKGTPETLAGFAGAKRLPLKFLTEQGLADRPGGGIVIPYYDETGEPLFERTRGVPGGPRFRQPAGVKLTPYGLWRLADYHAGCLVITEGESDALTLWHHQQPALGLPGAESCRCLTLEHLSGVDRLYVAGDADDAGKRLVEALTGHLAEIGYKGRAGAVVLPAGTKDVSDQHCHDPAGFGSRWAKLLEDARPLLVAAAPKASAGPAKSKAAPSSGGDKRKGASTLIVERVQAGGVELFHTPDLVAYADVEVGGHREVWPVRSSHFRRYLSRLYYDLEARTPGAQAVADAVGVLEGQAQFAGEERAVHVRVAESGGSVYLDLCDADWRAVRVNANGWTVVPDPPVAFRRSAGMLSLPAPRRGGGLDVLREAGLVNVADDDGWHLAAAWLVAAARPKGPYPLLQLRGEQGTAKTTFGRILRRLIDPSVTALRSAPKDDRDLMIAASNGWVVAYDNLSHLPGWLSDALCRLATGGGFATRTLYSNDEETLFDATRPVILTGIADVVTASDLLDRTVSLELQPIADGRRRTEEDVWARFDEVHAEALGGLLDAVSAGMRLHPTTRLDRLPRMADFARWAEACSRGAGHEEGAFLNAYDRSRQDANATALESHPLLPVLLRLVAQKGEFTGTASELLEKLNGLASDHVRRAQGWPTRGRDVSAVLKRASPNLRRAGIVVAFSRDGTTRTVSISRQEQGGNPASSASPASPVTQDAGGVTRDDAGVGAPASRHNSFQRNGFHHHRDADDADDAESALRSCRDAAVTLDDAGGGPGDAESHDADDEEVPF